MIDYDKKIEDIRSDYYKGIAKLKLLESNIKNRNYLIDSENDKGEILDIKNSMKDELLVDLGRCLELFFKYIVKIKRMELFPNEPYIGSQQPGFQEKEKLSIGVVKEIANKLNIDNNKVDNISNVQSIGPKSHDFNYVYKIIENLFPDINSKFKSFIELIAKSKIAEEDLKECNEFDIEIIDYITFPESIGISDSMKESQKELLRLIQKRMNTINYSGDIFTRLRYFANNPQDKSYDIDEIYELVDDVSKFCESIHLCNEKININPNLMFAYYMINKNQEYNRFTEEEFKKLLDNNLINENILRDILFYSQLDFEEIIGILSMDPKYFEETGYTPVLCQNLTKEILDYFFNIGIYDFDKMNHLLRRKDNMVDIFDYYSIEDFDAIRKKICSDSKDLSNMELLGYFKVDDIKILLNYPTILNFIKNEFIKNINKVSYNFTSEYFNIIINNEKVQKDPSILYGLDLDQLICYFEYSNMLMSDVLNEEIINRSNYYWNTISMHITENVEKFGDNKKLLYVLPLALDADDNEKILNLLIKNGLDINNLNGFDSTIFCMPLKLVEVIIKLLENNSENIIINNNVNPLIYDIINAMKNNYKSNVSLSKRRIPFYKSLVKNTSNPIVNELIFEEKNNNYNFLLNTEDKGIKKMNEFIKDGKKTEFVEYIYRCANMAHKMLTDEGYLKK